MQTENCRSDYIPHVSGSGHLPMSRKLYLTRNNLILAAFVRQSAGVLRGCTNLETQDHIFGSFGKNLDGTVTHRLKNTMGTDE
jgi:hypothetical protein